MLAARWQLGSSLYRETGDVERDRGRSRGAVFGAMAVLVAGYLPRIRAKPASGRVQLPLAAAIVRFLRTDRAR